VTAPARSALSGPADALATRDQHDDLTQLNRLLAPTERRAIERYSEPRWPTVFIFGAPRSGHTLVSQVLAATGGFGYISNFVARFWDAPSLAARIERALDLGETGGGSLSFASEFGKTSGWIAPHEGGNFLRRWIPFSDTHRADVGAVDDGTAAEIRREVAALEEAFERPIFLRNLVYGLNLDLVRPVFDQALFIRCTRDVVYQAQSILIARERMLGDRAAWWSLRPAEYGRIVELPVCEQPVAQIYWTGKAIEAGLAGVPLARCLEVSYEELTSNPRSEADRILRWVESFGAPPSGMLDGIPGSLPSRNIQRLGDADLARIRRATGDYFGSDHGG
jgi:hypothetical protein